MGLPEFSTTAARPVASGALGGPHRPSTPLPDCQGIPLTKRWRTATLEKFIRILEAVCWPVIRWARPHGTFGKAVMRMLPVASGHLQGVPLSNEDFREWIRLDTFDMLSPAYDLPQRYRGVKSWLENAGLRPDRRHPHGAISITATKPEAQSVPGAQR